MTTVNMLEAKTTLSRLVRGGGERRRERNHYRAKRQAGSEARADSANAATRAFGWDCSKGKYPPMSLEDFNSTDAEDCGAVLRRLDD